MVITDNSKIFKIFVNFQKNEVIMKFEKDLVALSKSEKSEPMQEGMFYVFHKSSSFYL